jgi:eukaryotic-like serine/threonine-protein kinase
VQVLTHIAERLADLHAAGCVHRNIKPGNIMWLPRKKCWILIDFGCAARTGDLARTGFSLFYAAPEVLVSHESGAPGILVTEALDAWSVGILAIEMFTGQPVFDLMQPQETVRGTNSTSCIRIC